MAYSASIVFTRSRFSFFGNGIIFAVAVVKTVFFWKNLYTRIFNKNPYEIREKRTSWHVCTFIKRRYKIGTNPQKSQNYNTQANLLLATLSIHVCISVDICNLWKICLNCTLQGRRWRPVGGGGGIIAGHTINVTGGKR